MADNNPKKPIPPASTQRTTMVMVIILLAVAFFVGSQFMRTGAMGTTVTDQLITSEFTQAVEQGRVKSVTYSAGDYTVSGTYFPAATAGSKAAAAFKRGLRFPERLMATEHGDDGKRSAAWPPRRSIRPRWAKSTTTPPLTWAPIRSASFWRPTPTSPIR